jgi:hypothetical protein
MVQQAKLAMSQEQLDEYKHIGEEMYKSVDFVTSEVLDNHASGQAPGQKCLKDSTPEEIIEAVAYINEAIKSGLHPDYLDENEKDVCKAFYGEDWMNKWL